MIRFSRSVGIVTVALLVVSLALPPGVLAKEPPGADLVAMGYSKGSGLAVLSRYELFVTADGKSWKQKGLFKRQEPFSALAVGNKLTLVAAESGTILRSVSSGPFEAVPPPRDPYGRIAAPIHTMAIGPKGKEVLASSGQGVILSKDGGLTWAAITDPFWKNPEARQVIQVAYIGNNPVIVTRNGAYRRSRGVFDLFSKGLPDEVKPTVAAGFGGRILMALPENGIYLATRANEWKNLPAAPGDPIAFLGFASQGYLAARPASPLHGSDSKGSTWKPVGNYSPGFIPMASASTPFGDYLILRGKGLVRLEGGIFQPVELPSSLSSIFAELRSDSGWIAGTQGGVYFSSNRGSSWEDVTPLNLGSPVNVFLQASDDMILLGSEGSGVFMSTDGGKNWMAWNRGLGTANTVKGLVKYDGGYMAATENGLMWTAPGSKPSWSSRNGGIGRVSVGILFRDGDTCWLGSHRGVFTARDGADFRPARGFMGRTESMDVSGSKILALVEGKVLLGEIGRVKELAVLPAGIKATSVAFISGQPAIGTTRGAYGWDGSSWSQVSFDELPVVRIIREDENVVRWISAGAGTSRYP